LSALLARDEADAVAVREVTLRLLTATTAPDGPAAAQMIGIQVLAQSAWRASAAGEAVLPWLRKLRDYPSGHLDRDPSLTRFLQVVRSPGSRLPAVVRRTIFRRGVPALGFRSFFWTVLLVPALATLAGMLAFLPPEQPATDTTATDTSATSATSGAMPEVQTTGTIASSETSSTTATDTAVTFTTSTMSMPAFDTSATTGTASTTAATDTFATDTSLTDTSSTEMIPTGTTSTTGTAPQTTDTADSVRTDSADFYFEVECGTSIGPSKGAQNFKLQRGERIVDATVTNRTVSDVLGFSANARLIAIRGNTVDFEYSGVNKSPEAGPGCPPARVQVHIVVKITTAAAAGE
jgi:hypothetical protein